MIPVIGDGEGGGNNTVDCNQNIEGVDDLFLLAVRSQHLVVEVSEIKQKLILIFLFFFLIYV